LRDWSMMPLIGEGYYFWSKVKIIRPFKDEVKLF
jgi:hypothetical protein